MIGVSPDRPDADRMAAAVGATEPDRRWPDLVMALLAFAAVAPLLILIAAALAACGRSPLLWQARVGHRGRAFSICKFRTLDQPRPGDVMPGLHDRCFVALGAFLRGARLDELPQLLNVVRGEMALIGPRPLLAEDHAGLPGGGACRTTVLPGITGLAQVMGGQLLRPAEKLAWDLRYVEQRTRRLDLWILGMTLVCMVRGDSTGTAGQRPASPLSLPQGAEDFAR